MADVNIQISILTISPVRILDLSVVTNSCNIISPIMTISSSIEVPTCQTAVIVNTTSTYV